MHAKCSLSGALLRLHCRSPVASCSRSGSLTLLGPHSSPSSRFWNRINFQLEFGFQFHFRRKWEWESAALGLACARCSGVCGEEGEEGGQSLPPWRLHGETFQRSFCEENLQTLTEIINKNHTLPIGEAIGSVLGSFEGFAPARSLAFWLSDEIFTPRNAVLDASPSRLASPNPVNYKLFPILIPPWNLISPSKKGGGKDCVRQISGVESIRKVAALWSPLSAFHPSSIPETCCWVLGVKCNKTCDSSD